MALELSKTLYNDQIVSYHRIAEYRFVSERLVIAKLESYRSRQHREFSFIPVIACDIDFPWSGSTGTLAAEAYTYIKTLPEWAGAADA